jgi:heterodisulfide reductase subunit D
MLPERFRKPLYVCMRDGYCRVMTCHEQGFEKICPIREFESTWEYRHATGKCIIARGLYDGEIELTEEVAKVFYMCTLCGNCREHCIAYYPFMKGYSEEKNLDTVELFEEIRAELVKQGFGPLKQHELFTKSIINYENPYQQPRTGRTRWLRRMRKDLKVKQLGKNNKADVLYYVGCTASYNQELQSMVRNTCIILENAGIDFGILGNDERCCGSTAKRVGDLQVFERQAKANIEMINELGVETVVTSCAGCYKTMKQDWPEFGELKPRLVHTVELVEELMIDDKLKLRKGDKGDESVVAYHDPCHLGRHNRIFDPPREILHRLPGLKVVEMYPTRENAFCCGAGGGVMSGYPDLAVKIAAGKIEKAVEVEADILTSACPFCLTNLAQGNKIAETQVREVADITDLITRCL